MGLFDSIRRVVGGGQSGSDESDGDGPGSDLVDTNDLDVAALRERAADVAGEVAQLDFSLDSLDQFDSAIDEGYDEDLATADDPGVYATDTVRFGCYLGEVLVRVHGGEWTRDPDWGVTVTGPEGTTTVAVFAVAERSIQTGSVFAAVADRAAVEVGLDGDSAADGDDATGADDATTPDVEPTVDGADDEPLADEPADEPLAGDAVDWDVPEDEPADEPPPAGEPAAEDDTADPESPGADATTAATDAADAAEPEPDSPSDADDAADAAALIDEAEPGVASPTDETEPDVTPPTDETEPDESLFADDATETRAVSAAENTTDSPDESLFADDRATTEVEAAPAERDDTAPVAGPADESAAVDAEPTAGDDLRERYAEEAEEFVAFWGEYDLDYTPASLQRLDALVSAEWDDDRFDDAEFGADGSFDDRVFTSVSTELGSYFGEVLIRDLDAEWSDETATDAVVVDGADGPLAIPVFKVAGTSIKQQPVFARSYDSLLSDLETA